jgi:glycosyltransferase involved in cell wall biosynthesis
MGSNRPSVSLCMIVRNEELQLADCLTPLMPRSNEAALFDEIVIVDTGSHDQTRRVAERFTPHVFDFPWCDDFSAARNETLRRSHGEWVMWLDADDRLDVENVARLGSLLKQLSHQTPDDKPRAYLMDTVCPAQHTCEGATLITHPRLFRRQADLRWRGRVHEQLRSGSTDAADFDAVWSDVQIHHLGYQDRAMQQRKRNRDVRLLRMDYAVDPDNISTLVHLGLAYFHLGRWQEARECLHRLLAAGDSPGEHLRQVYGVLATIAMREGNLTQALAALDQALLLFPDADYLSYLRADCLFELDRYPQARAALVRLINGAGQRQYRGGIPGDVKDKLAPRKLADVLLMEGQFAAAEALLQSIVSRFPDDTLSWHALGRVYLGSQQRTKFLAAAERLRSCPQGEIFASTLLASWHLGHHETSAAGALIDQLISQAPQMPLPRLLRCEWLTQINAPLPDRIQGCRDVLRVLPGDGDVRRLLARLEAELQSASRPMREREAAHAQVAAIAAADWGTTLVLGVGLPGGA